ncbi:hypothetical protein [Chelatococcus composti]|uniref:Uncharacterized protein n=1 Tax=Chelatococcus composti TaxID=1743235 RepID=A0A841K313_9HYPH|nr:hypothetical protein [Chelatococcus composti]MBB6166881.1 hypothetical protein [Chelatococcus composti]MBS7734195.1 hypothetical protein [Chelatococcus composti]GGG25124.1 hypothetical protein GCM10008026_01500 [Chelatococcus composti]
MTRAKGASAGVDPCKARRRTSGPAQGEALGIFEGDPLYRASLDGAEYEALLAAAGFRVLGHVVDDPSCGGHTAWLAARD